MTNAMPRTVEIEPVTFSELEHTHVKWRVEYSKRHWGPVLILTLVRVEAHNYCRMVLGSSPTGVWAIRTGWSRNRPDQLQEIEKDTAAGILHRKGWAWGLIGAFAYSNGSRVK